MSKQTAVNWLIEQLELESINDYSSFGQPHKVISLDVSTFQTLFDQARAMEREQLKNAWFDSTMQFDNAAEMNSKKSFDK